MREPGIIFTTHTCCLERTGTPYIRDFLFINFPCHSHCTDKYVRDRSWWSSSQSLLWSLTCHATDHISCTRVLPESEKQADGFLPRAVQQREQQRCPGSLDQNQDHKWRRHMGPSSNGGAMGPPMQCTPPFEPHVLPKIRIPIIIRLRCTHIWGPCHQLPFKEFNFLHFFFFFKISCTSSLSNIWSYEI